MVSRSAFAAALTLGVGGSLVAGVQPASARRPPLPDVRGSYFGTFVAPGSGTWAGEVNLFLQRHSG